MYATQMDRSYQFTDLCMGFCRAYRGETNIDTVLSHGGEMRMCQIRLVNM